MARADKRKAQLVSLRGYTIEHRQTAKMLARTFGVPLRFFAPIPLNAQAAVRR